MASNAVPNAVPVFSGEEARRHAANRLAGFLLAAAMAIVLLPTLYSFATVFWLRSNDTHAPIVLAGIGVGFWNERKAFDWTATRAAQLTGFGVAIVAAALYVLGRSQSFYQLEGVGAIGLVGAAILVSGGTRALRRLGYLAALLIFVVPIPASIADRLLVPLKMMLSEGVVRMFQILGYPIANHGVILSVGFYELQIADACAGLRSLLSLSAMGFLFVYFVPSTRAAVTWGLLLLIPFIAIAANFMRVSALVLITYYFGGDSGVAAHNTAAYLEIGVALLMFLGTHAALEKLLGRPENLRLKHHA